MFSALRAWTGVVVAMRVRVPGNDRLVFTANGTGSGTASVRKMRPRLMSFRVSGGYG